ncbi:hypothetical protein D3C72_1961170 [compost metagenome]
MTLPAPADPYDSLPGCWRAYSTNAAALSAGTDGWTSKTSGMTAVLETGAKSLTGSNAKDR